MIFNKTRKKGNKAQKQKQKNLNQKSVAVKKEEKIFKKSGEIKKCPRFFDENTTLSAFCQGNRFCGNGIFFKKFLAYCGQNQRSFTV